MPQLSTNAGLMRGRTRRADPRQTKAAPRARVPARRNGASPDVGA